jgi:AraC family transcriptional regulator
MPERMRESEVNGMQNPIEKAIWFIESHFARDITLDELAGVCGMSRFQMSRLFSQATGMTVTAYVRGRRLTEAARALANGAPDILPLALQAGYGSHEAFSRAFRDQFGLNPTEVRARASLDGIPLLEPMRDDPKVAVHLAPPRIETPGPLLIAGLGRRFASNDFAGIPTLWQELHPHLGAIPSQKGGASYGVVTQVAAGGDSYFYLAGVEVSDTSDLDPGFTRLQLPAQCWAVFKQEGHIITIASTVNAVFGQALPATGLTPGDMPDLLERYDESFDPQTGKGGFEIWVPVK